MKNLSIIGYPEYSITSNGNVFSIRANRFLKNYYYKDGYSCINLKGKTFYTHRLVMLSYKPVSGSEALQVNHINGDKHDNRLINLEWVIPKGNSQHAVTTGLNPCRSLTEEQVRQVCVMLEDNIKVKEIGSTLGVNEGVIRSIKSRDNYTDITCEYNWVNRKRAASLSYPKVLEICKMLKNGKTNKDIAELFNCTEQVIRGIRARRTFKNFTSSLDW